MLLHSVKIQNFRSIKEAEITCSDFTGIVGQNNAGKSSILKALNCFFNIDEEKSAFLNGGHEHNSGGRTFSTIECKFDHVPTHGGLAKYYDKDSLTLRFRYRNSKFQWHYKKKRKYIEISEENWKKIEELPNYYLIPTFRNHDQIHGMENSLLRQLTELYINDRRDNISTDIEDVGQKIVKIFGEIQKESPKHYPLKTNIDLQLGFKRGIDFKPLFVNELKFIIKEGSKEFLPRDCGAGVQSSIIISLIKLLAEKSSNAYILGLEEPESNLHPHAQREIITSFKKVSESSEHIQVLSTTHSSIVVDSLRHEDIVLCQKNLEANKRPVTTCYQLPLNFSEIAELDSAKSETFFRYRNSEFFYSDMVFICEGPTDCDVINKLAERESINLVEKGVSFLKLDGVHNLIYPLTLIKQMNIPHWIFVDKDFFLPYRYSSFKESLSPNGAPQYMKQFSSKAIKSIKLLIDAEPDRKKILDKLTSNHSQAMKELEKYKTVCFNYSLEIDLLQSSIGVKEMKNTIAADDEMTTKDLILNEKHKIKASRNILAVIDKLENRNLPNSYKAIRRLLKKL